MPVVVGWPVSSPRISQKNSVPRDEPRYRVLCGVPLEWVSSRNVEGDGSIGRAS